MRTRRYVPYEQTVSTANIVVDGSPNAATVLTLSHWPGQPVAPEHRADLSAQMAFRFLDDPTADEVDADVVTNNHFDQDGLVGLFALCSPDEALARRELLEDVAAAGDFGTYRDRRAARASMIIDALADPARSPLVDLPADETQRCARLYREGLELLVEIVERPEGREDLWVDEDRALTASEAAIRAGDVTIDEDLDLDLAVVTVPEGLRDLGGHRFVGYRFEHLHPMALHNATDRTAVLVVHGAGFRFTYRYETWVQFSSRAVRPRVALEPLAERLTDREPGDVEWVADPVGRLSPSMAPRGGVSGLARGEVADELRRHLATAPVAWDPFPE
ncbi:MAG: DUF6687 family protein [Actinomycetota bacterium]|nr:DUF6687 family protein [Actinomycetota bacterium]